MFVKLFEQILDSSIAENYKTRLVFEDMLLLADKNGILDMTHEAFARRTNVPLKVVKAAILQLERPDLKSRRPDCDGRRIVKIDENREWGWRLVNFEHYRKLRNEEDRAEYMRNLMADKRKGDKKQKDVSGVLAPVSNCKQQLAMLANAESESESESESEEEKIAVKVKPSQPASRIKLCTEDWLNSLKPDCEKQGIDLDTEIIKAKRWLLKKPNRKFTRSMFINWLNNCDKTIRENNLTQTHPDKKSFDQIRDEIITKLEEAALSGGDAISRCLSACHNIYHDKKVINEAYDIFKFRNKKAGG